MKSNFLLCKIASRLLSEVARQSSLTGALACGARLSPGWASNVLFNSTRASRASAHVRAYGPPVVPVVSRLTRLVPRLLVVPVRMPVRRCARVLPLKPCEGFARVVPT